VEAVVNRDGSVMMTVGGSDKTKGGCIGRAATIEGMYVCEKVELAFLGMVWVRRLSACALVGSWTGERRDEA
jgi:hypothetical protein